MWACPTGAFSTSPYHCEYWPHPPPPIQAKLTCSVQLAVCVASSGPSVSGTIPCSPSALCWHPATLQEASRSSLSPVQREMLHLPTRQQGEARGLDKAATIAWWGQDGGGVAGSRVKDQAVEHCHQPSWSPVSALMPCFRKGSPLRSLSRFL